MEKNHIRWVEDQISFIALPPPASYSKRTLSRAMISFEKEREPTVDLQLPWHYGSLLRKTHSGLMS